MKLSSAFLVILIFQLNTFLPYRINSLAEQISRSLAQVYAERFNVTVAQWRIIAVLHEYPGLSAKEVTARCNLDKVKVSRAVADLESRSLLARRTIADDRRASELRLTAKGLKLFAEISTLAVEWEADLLAELDSKERRTLLVLLGRLEEAMDTTKANTVSEV